MQFKFQFEQIAANFAKRCRKVDKMGSGKLIYVQLFDLYFLQFNTDILSIQLGAWHLSAFLKNAYSTWTHLSFLCNHCIEIISYDQFISGHDFLLRFSQFFCKNLLGFVSVGLDVQYVLMIVAYAFLCVGRRIVITLFLLIDIRSYSSFCSVELFVKLS